MAKQYNACEEGRHRDFLSTVMNGSYVWNEGVSHKCKASALRIATDRSDETELVLIAMDALDYTILSVVFSMSICHEVVVSFTPVRLYSLTCGPLASSLI